jgi:alanyl-tRNA synthetase
MAQREANEAIFAQVPVSDSWVPKDSELIEAIRIKVERIHGDQVRIVQIGELDKAACAGVHVSNTREIRMLLVTGLTSARPAGDFEIEFETGRKAMETALGLSAIGLQAAEALRAQTEDLLNAVQNLKAEAHRAQESLREYAAQALSRLEPERLEGVRLYSGAFRGVDKRTLVDAANAMVRGERTAAILASVDERLMMLVATSNDLEVDSRLILSEALSPIGGRGGGGRNFASGGANDGAGAEAALAAAKGALLKTLSK